MPLAKCPACGKEISTEATACPNCGHPLAKLAAKKNQQKGCLGCFTIILIVVGLATWAVIIDKSGENSTTFDVNKPETITSIIHEATAHPTATFENGKVSLTYSIDPWLLTASTAKSQFFFKAKEFFQKAFSSPAVQSACVEGTATFQDIRGNQSQGKAMSLCVSRANAHGVNWDNVATGSMPSIADSSFIHPSFNK